MSRHPTVRATIFIGELPVDVEAEVYHGCPDRFDRRFGNWLPGDAPRLYDLRRVDGEWMNPSEELAAETAIWDAAAQEDADNA